MEPNGNFIRLQNLGPIAVWQWYRPSYRNETHYTDDWSKAVARCGELNDQHQLGDTLRPIGRGRYAPAVEVGGYEVVSETIG